MESGVWLGVTDVTMKPLYSRLPSAARAFDSWHISIITAGRNHEVPSKETRGSAKGQQGEQTLSHRLREATALQEWRSSSNLSAFQWHACSELEVWTVLGIKLFPPLLCSSRPQSRWRIILNFTSAASSVWGRQMCRRERLHSKSAQSVRKTESRIWD